VGAAQERAPLRDRIIDAALELLSASGMKKLSQPQVAKAAGIPQGHLTYYFPKKRDLVMAVARRAIEVFAREVSDFLQSGGWPGADAPTRQRVLALVGFLVKDRARTRFLLGLLLEGEDDPGLRALLVEHAGLARHLAARALGQRRHDADPGADLDVDLMLATLWGLAIQHLLFAGTRPADVTDQLISRMVRHSESQGGKKK